MSCGEGSLGSVSVKGAHAGVAYDTSAIPPAPNCARRDLRRSLLYIKAPTVIYCFIAGAHTCTTIGHELINGTN